MYRSIVSSGHFFSQSGVAEKSMFLFHCFCQGNLLTCLLTVCLSACVFGSGRPAAAGLPSLHVLGVSEETNKHVLAPRGRC